MEIKILKTAKRLWQDLRIPFGFKLMFIVTLILLGSIWAITTLMSLMVRSEFIRTTEETNFGINNRAASGIEERLYKIRSEALLLLEMSSVAENSASMATQLQNIFFERNPYIGAVIIPSVEEIINRSFFTHNEIPLEALRTWIAREADTVERARAGEPVLRNVTPALGINLLALFYPWQNTGFMEAAVVFFAPQNLLEITGTGSNTTVVVNEEGDILVSPDFSQVLGGENISSNPLFETLWRGEGETVRQSFTAGGNRYVGAGHRVSLANAAVFTFLEYSIITEQITAVTRRNIMLSITVMFLSILITWFYGRIITSPIKNLIAAAGKIEKGEFSLDLKPQSRDELGTLTERFITMGYGLLRWENAMNLMGRYNNQSITDKAMAGEINLKGEYLKAVVLSVDLVSFNDFTRTEAEETEKDQNKGLDVNPGEVLNPLDFKNPEAPLRPENFRDPEGSLEHLNFLISKIAENVEKTGGVVDKIAGSRIIAVWGIPFSSGDILNEIMNCLRSVIMMRTQLWEINTEQESQGNRQYKIHCGIHTGDVLAGSLGSFRYYKYTVIGETIDQAIKAGEVCDFLKTDIIITEAVRTLAGKRILAEEIKNRKPNKDDLKVFGLVNLASQGQEKQRWPFTLKDVQESLKEGTIAPAR